ncbi:ribosomal-protein-alanine N-acetyltransferase [Thalassoglobus neptunius]|uniref:Ribosomal-protein-alanine N-acetyltransferase n=2 Tax=Thalassoglobus neptunius TaxID=1938619 RepID=A0A5C5WY05_9PLAN|nr:ribosomal-protein-alanine N-acetyltransferase [Thalassoglobus neptunius]
MEPSSSSENRLDVQIRWLIRRDMTDVIQIEQSSYGEAWTDEDFLTCLRQRNCIGMVAEHDQKIVGFMIYELHKSRLHILNFAVAPEARRQGIGTQMVLRLIDKLSQQRRSEILIEVRESDLDTQLFFKKQGFRAVCVLRRHFDDTEEDAYTMRFQLAAEHGIDSQFAIRNRISQFGAA